MDAPTKEKPEGCLEQCYKGNLRVRLFQFTRDDGSLAHLVEVAAWNAWAGQAKLISAVGGIDLEQARRLFQDLCRDLSHYDWMEDKVVMVGDEDDTHSGDE